MMSDATLRMKVQYAAALSEALAAVIKAGLLCASCQKMVETKPVKSERDFCSACQLVIRRKLT